MMQSCKRWGLQGDKAAAKGPQALNAQEEALQLGTSNFTMLSPNRTSSNEQRLYAGANWPLQSETPQ
jgi:hypothetical protein